MSIHHPAQLYDVQADSSSREFCKPRSSIHSRDGSDRPPLTKKNDAPLPPADATNPDALALAPPVA